MILPPKNSTSYNHFSLPKISAGCGTVITLNYNLPPRHLPPQGIGRHEMRFRWRFFVEVA